MTNGRLVQSLVLSIAVLIALSFGFSFGNVGNQATYFPHALNHIYPEFLGNDWLVQETTVYHASFRWVIVGLAGLGSVAWGAAILNVVLLAASIFTIYQIVVTLAREDALWAMALVAVCIVLDRTGSVGASFLFSDGLQPSTLATTAWLIAIWAFLRQQYVASGLLLALGGLFHTNFLVLGIGLFALAHLFLKEKHLAKRMLVQLVPSLLMLGFSLPLILAAASGEGASQARDIFLLIRSPHHYVPLSYRTEFFYLGGWFLCALSALFALPGFPLQRALLALFLAFGISLAGATLLTTVVFVPQISQLYVWRLAPFLLILSQITVAIFLIRQLSADAFEYRHRRLLAIGALIGVLMILRWVVYVNSFSIQVAITAVLIGIYLVAWFMRRKSRGTSGQRAAAIAGCAAITVALVLTAFNIPGVFANSTLLHDHSDGLNAWVDRTDKTSVFLVPVEFGDFRLLAGRPVVVDWKSTPVKPDELIEWYSRINAIAGKPVRSLDQAVSGFRSHDLPGLRKIAGDFGADYIVVNTAKQRLTNTAELPLFRNKKYSVYPAHPEAVGTASAALAHSPAQ